MKELCPFELLINSLIQNMDICSYNILLSHKFIFDRTHFQTNSNLDPTYYLTNLCSEHRPTQICNNTYIHKNKT